MPPHMRGVFQQQQQQQRAPQQNAQQLKQEIMDLKQQTLLADQVRETKLELLRSHWCVHCVCIYVH